MKIKKLLDALEEKSKPGGPLHRLHPLIEAQDTFVRTPDTRTGQGPHVRDFASLKRMMVLVVAALAPCIFMGIYNAGYQRFSALGQEAAFIQCMVEGAKLFVPILLVSYVVGGLWELLFALVRKHEITEGFFVTGLLFPLTLPPTIPLWQVAVGISFGVVIGKEVFGGTGMNILNPALTARAFIFFAYPARMSGDNVWVAVNSAKETLVDGFSGASPLGVAFGGTAGEGAVQLLSDAGITLKALFLGLVPGSVGETSVLACLIGTGILLATGVASWKIMASMLAGGTLTALLLNMAAGPESSALMALPFYYHLSMGGFAFGLVYMATDPVTAASTETGKYIYGFLTGCLAITIRALNPAYPEGVMLAILFMNIFSPLIDYYVVQENVKKRLRRAKR
ncbi:NADH:ubiquinone reductase (Na(+)-transporting) subunit B [Fibrobacterota bacterium]